MKDYTLLAIAIPLSIAVLVNLPGCYADKQKQGEDKREYDYGIVKRGDTLFIYKDGKPVGCDVDSTGVHAIGDILEYSEIGLRNNY